MYVNDGSEQERRLSFDPRPSLVVFRHDRWRTTGHTRQGTVAKRRIKLILSLVWRKQSVIDSVDLRLLACEVSEVMRTSRRRGMNGEPRDGPCRWVALCVQPHCS